MPSSTSTGPVPSITSTGPVPEALEGTGKRRLRSLSCALIRALIRALRLSKCSKCPNCTRSHFYSSHPIQNKCYLYYLCIVYHFLQKSGEPKWDSRARSVYGWQVFVSNNQGNTIFSSLPTKKIVGKPACSAPVRQARTTQEDEAIYSSPCLI